MPPLQSDIRMVLSHQQQGCVEQDVQKQLIAPGEIGAGGVRHDLSI